MSVKRCPRCNEVVEFDAASNEDSSAMQLLELVDGALEVVALWKATSPDQKKWQANWIKKAKEMGASFDDDYPEYPDVITKSYKETVYERILQDPQFALEYYYKELEKEIDEMKKENNVRSYDPFTCGYTPSGNSSSGKPPKAPKGGTGQSDDKIKDIGNNVAQMFATMFQDDRIECLHTKEDPLNEGTIITTISIPKADITRGASTDLLEDGQFNYVVHYKWQEGAELFFNREIIKDFAIKDEDALSKLENRLCVILSNCGMEEERLATVQVTGITQL